MESKLENLSVRRVVGEVNQKRFVLEIPLIKWPAHNSRGEVGRGEVGRGEVRWGEVGRAEVRSPQWRILLRVSRARNVDLI